MKLQHLCQIIAGIDIEHCLVRIALPADVGSIRCLSIYFFENKNLLYLKETEAKLVYELVGRPRHCLIESEYMELRYCQIRLAV